MTELKKAKAKAKTPAKEKPKTSKAAHAPLQKPVKQKPAAKAAAKPKHKIAVKPPALPKASIVTKPKSIKKEAPVLSVAQPPVQKPQPQPTVVQPPKAPEPKAAPQEALKPVKKEEIRKAEPPVPPPAPAPAEPALKELELTVPIVVKDLAVKLQEKPSVLIKQLMSMGIMAGINQAVDEAVAAKICEKYGMKIKHALSDEEVIKQVHEVVDGSDKLKHRAPIVTLMGHVDHGKTSLLDAIRNSKVTEKEHGGITQHIGAYRVKLPHGEITFLDTPGHEAFTAMRARGASVTDIVVLVVAADEGIMPQTQEAIDHARAAGVTIMVAMNKIDKATADVDKLKKQLSEVNLMAEDWGGKTITVGVSAKTGAGIDGLLEMILLEAQMLELKANPDRLARGVVIEAKSSKHKGPVVTLLVKNGTLRLNDNIIVGTFFGKVRAMFNDRGQPVTEAAPSFPVEVLGISGLPQAGEEFLVIADEKKAKEIVLERQERAKEEQLKPLKRIGLEDLYSQIKEGKLKELKLILKADAQGSLEAIKETLQKITTAEITINFIHEGIGNINSSDVILAVASNALILGFNVVADDMAKDVISKEGQEVRTYNIIYELANDIKAALEGMLEPKLKRVFMGKVEIRKVFKLSRSGTIAGCFVTKGKIARVATVSLVRNGEEIFEGSLLSLKRFKDDVKEVTEGFECGIALKGFDGVMEGDVIEAYLIEKIARKL
jgi:translation initiation factor IF-2